MKFWTKYVLRRRQPAPPPDQPARLKAVIFDFDGTIADTFEAGFEILNRLSSEFGFRSLSREELGLARDMRTRELMKFLGIPTTKMSGIARRGSQELSKRINDIQPLPGVVPILHELQARGLSLGIVTSNTEANVQIFLKNHDLEIFDFIRSSSRLLGKSREIRGVMKRLRLRDSEVLFVGDETRDIEAAQKAGIPIAAVTWGYNSRKSIEAMTPDYVLDRPEELVELLDSLLGSSKVA